jgi:short-subunit dehydrogenase
MSGEPANGRGVLQGRHALVTGSSSGLGVEFARELARRGCDLTLVARRKDRLQALRQELCARYRVDVLVVPVDLAAPGATQCIYEEAKESCKPVDILVNNAGFGIYGEAVEIPWEQEKNMLDLNIIALAHLTKLFAKDMLSRNFGFILQIASIGAYQPSPTYASYSAAKSYVLHFGEALNYELRSTGVSCTVLSPGISATEFFKVSGQQPSLYQRLVMMQPSKVARIGIESMLKRKASVVPGRLNATTIFLNRLLPRRLSAAISYRLITSQ